MKLIVFQKGFNFSKDGQGNRLVYHLQGCNMRCPWCANPEGMAVNPPLWVEESFLLDSLCPYGAVKDKKIDRAVCKSCKNKDCVTKSINKGITVKSTGYELDEIVAEVLKSRPMFFDGGGVTLTGGEPTMQFEAVKALLIRLKENGIHTALETNGTSPRLPELFPYIDQLMTDYKHSDGEKLKEIGCDKNVLESNIRKAIESGKTVHIRIPLIGDFNAGRDNLSGTVEFFKTLDRNFFTVELLPFHEYGKEKWQHCGLNYLMTKEAYVSPKTLEQFQTVFKQNNSTMIHT